MKKTIKDIAEITGYSKSTISRVLTGKGYVKDSVKNEIQKVIKEIDYQPQEKHVIKEVRDMVMVIACQLDSEVQMQMVMSIQKKMKQHGLRTAIISAEFDENIAYEYIDYAREKNFGGVITLGVLDTPEFHTAVKKLQCPIVLLNQRIEGIDACSVKFAEYDVSKQATNYLLEMGHEKIAFLSGYENAVAIQERKEGFQHAMLEAGYEENQIHLIHKDFNETTGSVFAKEMIEAELPYTAVIASTDILCYGLVKELRKQKIQIPNDISVIGFGGSIFEKTIGPDITVIDYDFDQIGNDLADLLIENINKPLMKTKEIIYEPKLLIRQSVKNLNH